ncbi:hypothetical protein [Leifsonia shinshuensis]|uniref:hypothetical protein n=1 Tax=Leifsonia shinshuensis TaxID=150026 RepID=UPI00285A9C0B|nr:hypothetical protein [Leifsonia shinshuensis]MDR6969749.1 hypothetical protein [Leifsonia shinshuensis]
MDEVPQQPPSATGENTPPPSPRPAPLPRWLLPLATGIAGLLLGIGVMGGAWAVSSATAGAAHAAAQQKAKAAAAKKAEAQKSVLKDALSECGLMANDDAELADSGYTLTVNGEGDEDYSGLSIEDEACLLRTLNAPSAVVSHIDQTTSLDGRQSETWSNVSFSWTYHPDRGLDGVFTVSK